LAAAYGGTLVGSIRHGAPARTSQRSAVQISRSSYAAYTASGRISVR
jgi:hypothetical protein